MERPWAGTNVELMAPFFEADGTTPLASPTGVSFVVERVGGGSRAVAAGEPTSQAHVFRAVLPVASAGSWEAQARCTGPVPTYSPKLRFEVVQPIDFAPP